MMDFDPKTVPSRMFIRFIAHEQLMADMTGEATTVNLKRLGREPFVQEILPGGKPPLSYMYPGDSEDPIRGDELTMRMSMNWMGDRPQVDSEPSDIKASEPSDFPSPTPEDAPLEEDQIDEALFKAIVDTTFNPNQHPELFRTCDSVEAAAMVEAKLVSEIITVYRTIKAQQANPIVQGLNKLL